MSSWVYLTLGVIIALIALGIVAINTAINQEYDTKKDAIQQEQDVGVPRLLSPLTIKLQEEGFTGMANEITYQLILQRGESATIFAELELDAPTKDDLSVEVYVRTESETPSKVMPSTLKATVHNPNVVLKYGQKVQVPVTFEASPDAPDAWYIVSVYAKWSEVNGFIGTPFYLKVGKGSNCLTILSESGSYCIEP